MTPREFANAAQGIQRRRLEDYRLQWETTRMMMFSFSSPYMKKKNATPQDVLQFPWEKDETEIDLVKEEEAVQKQKEFWEKIDKGKATL
ncbi:hypothetical protein ASG38_14980 [Flavobacterium sp. Leaf359]|uniref:hypothetical protein n=1 Tax=Flavobacterium sp. Leaf359 TaxID=1736351 RepID=UPI0006FE7714|nr:hypothetical protein [Flavobacterium sp. Leaf359]KQS45911.1 hypothetical protein ASG38_14980 [Flavobacterium sp. Leaf359]